MKIEMISTGPAAQIIQKSQATLIKVQGPLTGFQGQCHFYQFVNEVCLLLFLSHKGADGAGLSLGHTANTVVLNLPTSRLSWFFLAKWTES